MKFHFVKASMNVVIAAIIVLYTVLIPALALAASASQIDRGASQSLTTLYKHTPGAKALADKAVAVLVFPSIVKGGFIIAGQFGDGALRKNGKTVAY
jgi:lipid-binding SYLF domain-containing protein